MFSKTTAKSECELENTLYNEILLLEEKGLGKTIEVFSWTHIISFLDISIPAITYDDGNKVTHSISILELQRKFCQHLYQSQGNTSLKKMSNYTL